MKKSKSYFLLLKSLWLIGDLAIMMLCEKWIELLTGNPISIIMVMLIYYCVIYVFSFIIDKIVQVVHHPLWLCSPLLIGSVCAVILYLYDGTVAVGWVYALMIMIGYLSVVTTTCASLLMDERVEADQKPKLLSINDFTEGLIGSAIFLIGGIVLVDLVSIKLFLIVAAVSYVAAYIFLYLLNKQTKVEIGMEVVESLGTLKMVYLSPIILFILFFIAKLFYASIDPLHTVYIADQLHSGQEVTFRFVGCLYIGGLMVSLFVPKILKRMSIVGVYFLLFLVLAGYYSTLWIGIPLEAMYMLLIVVGASAHLMSTAIMIHLHHHYSKETLGRYLLLFQQGEAVGPCVSFILVAVLTGLLHLSFGMLMILFIGGVTIPVISIALLFQLQKRKIGYAQ